jgi:hypothetical protein
MFDLVGPPIRVAAASKQAGPAGHLWPDRPGSRSTSRALGHEDAQEDDPGVYLERVTTAVVNG